MWRWTVNFRLTFVFMFIVAAIGGLLFLGVKNRQVHAEYRKSHLESQYHHPMWVRCENQNICKRRPLEHNNQTEEI